MRAGDDRFSLCRRFKNALSTVRNEAAADKNYFGKGIGRAKFTDTVQQNDLGFFVTM